MKSFIEYIVEEATLACLESFGSALLHGSDITDGE